ncbi:unnamed protein product [Sphagnum jensenii]|uniref:CASP-like protein n=1 Tax=Sphagnum jensenii TaxID=128206 RepID=A0ABP0W0A3_9BRYO
MVFQFLWSLFVALVDVYAMTAHCSIQCLYFTKVLALGDWVTSFMTLSAACASAGITTFLDNNFNQCATNHCGKYEGAIAMAMLCWMVVSLSFYHSFWFMTMRFIHLTKSISFKLWIKWSK